MPKSKVFWYGAFAGFNGASVLYVANRAADFLARGDHAAVLLAGLLCGACAWTAVSLARSACREEGEK